MGTIHDNDRVNQAPCDAWAAPHDLRYSSSNVRPTRSQ